MQIVALQVKTFWEKPTLDKSEIEIWMKYFI